MENKEIISNRFINVSRISKDGPSLSLFARYPLQIRSITNFLKDLGIFSLKKSSPIIVL